MSAIAGVWTRGSAPEPREACVRMLAAQAIHAPTAPSQWDGGEVSIGRRLWRLLPEDAHDRQPLEGGGGRFVLVADLRLDNREDLVSALGVPVEMAPITCDAAILLAAWERWSETCFDRLVGVYAFAVWDRERAVLTLARDPLGHRPLHYHCGSGFVAFASMPKGLHALEAIPRAPDEATARDFLALMPEHGGGSFFAGVQRVEPGCLVRLTAEGARSTPHWRPVRRPLRIARPEDYVDAAREHLDRAVCALARGSETRIGAHLSAGLDSPAVAATAARLLAAKGGRVVAFTATPRAGFERDKPSPKLRNEGPLAAATAALYPNIDHVLVPSTGRSPTDTLDRDHFLYDRPVLNLCNSDWVHEINREAQARGLSVVLTGLTGNMGLTYDGREVLPEYIAHGRFLAWFRLARVMVRAKRRRWRGAVVDSVAPWIPPWLWGRLERLRGQDTGALADYTALNPAVIAGLDYPRRSAELGMDPYFRPGKDSFAARMTFLRRVDPGNYLKGSLSGWGVDLRDPMADRRLLEFCLNVPNEQFVLGGVTRSLARRALADRLPAEVVNETRQGQQGADWYERLTAGRFAVAEWVSRLEGCPPAVAALDLARMRRLADNWPEGGWDEARIEDNYRAVLLRGLSVGHFMHRASGANS